MAPLALWRPLGPGTSITPGNSNTINYKRGQTGDILVCGYVYLVNVKLNMDLLKPSCHIGMLILIIMVWLHDLSEEIRLAPLLF